MCPFPLTQVSSRRVTGAATVTEAFITKLTLKHRIVTDSITLSMIISSWHDITYTHSWCQLSLTCDGDTLYTSHWSPAVTGKILSTSRVSSRYTYLNSLHNTAMCADLHWFWLVTNILFLHPSDIVSWRIKAQAESIDIYLDYFIVLSIQFWFQLQWQLMAIAKSQTIDQPNTTPIWGSRQLNWFKKSSLTINVFKFCIRWSKLSSSEQHMFVPAPRPPLAML